jgi:hypothetical protein
MTTTAARRTGWTGPAVCLAVFGALAVLSTVALVPLSVLARQNVNGAIALVIGIPAAAVGAVAARRLPRNPVAWLLLAIGICLILATDGSDYTLPAYRLGHPEPRPPFVTGPWPGGPGRPRHAAGFRRCGCHSNGVTGCGTRRRRHCGKLVTRNCAACRSPPTPAVRPGPW